MFLQYIPRNMHTVFALLCFVVVIHWLIFPYPSGLLHWHCGNLTINPVPAKQPWWIWINTSCEFIMNDYITTTKQSTTKPCAYFLGYTVFITSSWTARMMAYHLFERNQFPEHDDVIKWKHFPRNWLFVRRIHRSPVNSTHKGQWRGALMFTLICARINGWVNTRETGDLRRNRPHCDVIVMTNLHLLPIGPFGINFSWIWITISILISFHKKRLEMSSAKCSPFCPIPWWYAYSAQ